MLIWNILKMFIPHRGLWRYQCPKCGYEFSICYNEGFCDVYKDGMIMSMDRCYSPASDCPKCKAKMTVTRKK